MKNARLVVVLSAVTIMIISPGNILQAEGPSSGSQIFVHISGHGTASVCVYSDSENLGCRTVNSPDTIPFVFKNTRFLVTGQKFNACIQTVKLYCTTSTYDPLTDRARHVYLSVPEFSNNMNKQKSLDPLPPVSAQQTKSYSQDFLLYSNPDHDFKIWYPSDWSINEGNITHTGVIISSPDAAGKILISSMNLSPIESRMTPAELAKIVLSSQNDTRSRFVELDANNYFLSGHPALKIVQIRNIDPALDDDIAREYKSMSLVTLVYGKAYFVSYISQPEIYPNYLQTAQTMIDSFEVTNK